MERLAKMTWTGRNGHQRMRPSNRGIRYGRLGGRGELIGLGRISGLTVDCIFMHFSYLLCLSRDCSSRKRGGDMKVRDTRCSSHVIR